MEDTKKMIGEIVNDRIKGKSGSIRHFAREIDMKHPQILKVLQGERNYTMDTLLKIVDALDLEIVIRKKKK